MKDKMELRGSWKLPFMVIAILFILSAVFGIARGDDFSLIFAVLTLGVGIATIISLIYAGFLIELKDEQLQSKFWILPFKSLQINEIERVDREHFRLYGSVHLSWIFYSKDKSMRVGEFAGRDNTLSFVKSVLDRNPSIRVPEAYSKIRILSGGELRSFIQEIERPVTKFKLSRVILGTVLLLLSMLLAGLLTGRW